MAITYASLTMSEEDHAAYDAALEKAKRNLASRSVFETYPDLDHTLFDFSPSCPSGRLTSVSASTPEDARDAVDTACGAQREIRELGWSKRRRILRRVAKIIEQRKFDIAAVLTLEVGKTRGEAMAEVLEVAAMIETYDRFCEETGCYTRLLSPGRTAPFERSISSLEPMGPVAVISPFNFPFALAANHVICAFLAGNPVVLKPASDTPIASTLFAEILIEAGAPDGACTVIYGSGGSAGEALVRDPRIALVAFTGSRSVGLFIDRICAEVRQQGVPRSFVAELGGKNPLIVTARADIEKAAAGIVKSIVGFSGQKCSALSRIYVDRRVSNDLIHAILDRNRIAAIRVGDPAERTTAVGPVINEAAFRRYQKLYDAVREDPRAVGIVTLSAQPGIADHLHQTTGGYFVEPLLVTGIPHDDPLNRTEHFLPVAFLHKVGDLDEAIRLANDTEYGLCSGIMSESEAEVEVFLKRAQAGVVYANRRGGATTGAWPGIQSFGGWKMSGLSGVSAF
ncbi:MAG: aldehyde dehydrogenase family protein, partial [Candidatus Terrybacteria bacterium]|nr:aldehyde dehydrogenase family protein [Candidatus Terrybacteria bacterium]